MFDVVLCGGMNVGLMYVEHQVSGIFYTYLPNCQ